MGLLGRIKRRVGPPKFLRMRKRKRNAEALTLASTCDVSEATDVTGGGATCVQKGEQHRDPPTLCTQYEALEEEEENELFSPTHAKTHDRHLFPEDTAKTTVVNDDNDVEIHTESCLAEKDAPGGETRYVTSSSEDEEESSNTTSKNKAIEIPSQTAESIFSPRPRQETAECSDLGDLANNSSVANLYTKHHGQEVSCIAEEDSDVLTHIYHDELSTLYEVPTDREDNDSIASSVSDLEDVLGGFQVSKKQRGKSKNAVDSIVRARWDYALSMMCGETSHFFGNVAKVSAALRFRSFKTNAVFTDIFVWFVLLLLP